MRFTKTILAGMVLAATLFAPAWAGDRLHLADGRVLDGEVTFDLNATVSTTGTWDVWVELFGEGLYYGFDRTRSPDSPPGSIQETGSLPPGESSISVFWTNDENSCADCSINAQGTVSYSLTLRGGSE